MILLKIKERRKERGKERKRVFRFVFIDMVERENNAIKERVAWATLLLKTPPIKRSQRDQLATAHRDIVLAESLFFHDPVIDQAP